MKKVFIISSKLSKSTTSKTIKNAMSGIVPKQRLKKYPPNAKGLCNIVKNEKPAVIAFHYIDKQVAKDFIEQVGTSCPETKFLYVENDWSAARDLIGRVVAA